MGISDKVLKICFFTGLGSLVAAVGCGGGGGPVIPHTTGNFTNASFKGSYVFQIRGVISSTFNPYRQVGVITADGNGNITGGVEDVNTIGTAGAIESTSVTGSYTIANDGTGQLVLNSTALGSLFSGAPITFAVTLASASKVQLLEADVFADGSGSAELQDANATGATPAGPFVFGIHEDLNTNSASESQVGMFTISSGNLSGSMDQNTIAGASSTTLTGNIDAPTILGSGTGTITDSSNNSTPFLYFIVNSGKFLLLPTNAAIGSGSAEAQSGGVSAGLSGNYVFGSRGDDLNAVGASATVGQFTANGNSITAGALDAIQDGNYSNLLQFTGSVAGSVSAQGREEVTLSLGPTFVFWLVSPSRAFFLDENSGAIEDGTADLQTGSGFSASAIKGQYALIMDGTDFINGQEVARIGTLQFDGSSGITLVELVNDSLSGGGAQSPGALSGHYQVGGSGRITTQISGNNGGGPDLVMYAISSSQAYAMQIDAGENTSGVIQLQQ